MLYSFLLLQFYYKSRKINFHEVLKFVIIIEDNNLEVKYLNFIYGAVGGVSGAGEMIIIVVNVLVSIFSLYLIIGSLNRKKAQRRKTETEDIMYLPPSELNVLIHSVNNAPRAIISTILDLYMKGNISITPYERQSRLDADDVVVEYTFKRNGNSDLDLKDTFFMEMLFDGEEEITTEQIEDNMEKKNSFTANQGKWFDMVQSDLEKKGFFDEDFKEESKKFFLIGGVALAISLFTIFSKHMIGVLSLFTSLGVILLGLDNMLIKSNTGLVHFGYWNEFYERASRLDLSQYDLSNPELLIYLIALALPMDIITKLREDFDKQLNTSFLNFFFEENSEGGSLFDDAILRSFLGFSNSTTRQAIDTNQASWRIFKS